MLRKPQDRGLRQRASSRRAEHADGLGLVGLQQFAIDGHDIFIAGDRRPAAPIIDLDHFELAQAGYGDRLGVHFELHQHLLAVLCRDFPRRVDGDANASDLPALLGHRIDLEGGFLASACRARLGFALQDSHGGQAAPAAGCPRPLQHLMDIRAAGFRALEGRWGNRARAKVQRAVGVHQHCGTMGASARTAGSIFCSFLWLCATTVYQAMRNAGRTRNIEPRGIKRITNLSSLQNKAVRQGARHAV